MLRNDKPFLAGGALVFILRLAHRAHSVQDERCTNARIESVIIDFLIDLSSISPYITQDIDTRIEDVFFH
jgi:hypothetical protein